jgi:phosphoribosylamine--glycine ligase
VYCAGVEKRGEELRTSGGRVITVVGQGQSLAAARERAYAGVAALDIAGSFHRSDIGHRALERAC